MIKSITLKNFQSHRFTKLVLSPNLNILIGKSNHGKTAILRALYKLTRNRPRGTQFVRNGYKTFRIRVRTDQGEVLKVMGPAVNKYIVNGVPYSKVGDIIPDEVNALQIVDPPIQIGDKQFDLNFQRATNPLFLVSDAPSQKAVVFDYVSGATQISNVLGLIGKDYRKFKTKKEEAKASYRKLKQDCIDLKVELDIVSDIYRTFQTLNSSETVLNKIDTYIDTLAMLYNVDQQIQKSDETLSLLNQVESLYKILQKLNELKKLRQVDYNGESLNDLLMLYHKLNKRYSLLQKINKFVYSSRRGGELRTQIHMKTKLGVRLQFELVKVKQKLGICPVCGNKL